jgi:hypothetical protein
MVSNQGMRIALLLALCVASSAGAQSLESRLLGNWACVSGPCDDPEIQFALEGGKGVYNSWLNERPSASGGSWTLSGRKLSIMCCGHASPSEWTVMRVSVNHLHLRPADSKKDAVYKRLK